MQDRFKSREVFLSSNLHIIINELKFAIVGLINGEWIVVNGNLSEAFSHIKVKTFQPKGVCCKTEFGSFL